MAQAIGKLTRGVQRTRQLPTRSGASFKEGQFLIWNNGVTRHAASDANLGATGATTRVVGMALEDSTNPDGTTKQVVGVMLAEPGTEFMLSLYHGTASSAVPTPNGQIGTAYELRNVGGNYDAIALDATSNTKVVVVDYATEEYSAWPGSEAGTTQGPPSAGTTQYANAWVEFLGSCIYLAAGR